MRVHALVSYLRGRSTLKAALKKRPGRDGGASLCFHDRWPDFHDALRQDAADVAVLDPWLGDGEPPPVERVEGSHCALGEGRVVLLVSPSTADLRLLQAFQALGPPHVLMARLDDHPTAVRPILGRAAAHACLAGVLKDLEGKLGSRQIAFLSRALSSAVGCTDADDLARRMGLTTRELWAMCRDLGLPPARRLLLWGRLFSAEGLRRLCVESMGSLAYLVGYQDPASLARLYRTLLGCPAAECPATLPPGVFGERLLEDLR